MKYETKSLMTKKALSASLKKLMEQKTLDKISIREIIEDCGVNRKTFYYHFEDIYDLLKWIFEEEAIEIVKQYDLILNSKDAIRFVLDYVEENKLICNCAFDALGRDELKRFFQKDFLAIIDNLIKTVSEGYDVPEDYKEFLTNFYTEALASQLIDYIRYREKYTKEKMVLYITVTLKASIMKALEVAEKELN